MPRQLTSATAPLDGALVRLPVRGDRWAEHLPPVPRGFDVTVSFSGEDVFDLHGATLALLGYRAVGIHAEPGQHAHVHVSEALLAARPRWWRALAAQADRSFGLAFGPARLALDELLRLHREPPPGG